MFYIERFNPYDKTGSSIERYTAGKCTSEEKALIEQWYQHELSSRNLTENLDDHVSAKSEIWASIREVNGLRRGENRTKKILSGIAASVGIIFIISTAAYFYRDQERIQVVKSNTSILPGQDIEPGINKAVLTLGDGSKINLDDSGDGLIATQSGIRIHKASNGAIRYEVIDQANYSNPKISYNTIETPKGGKYQIILPDGSKVWLNAASSLRFPSAFTGKKRDVELNGEAYFEVTKNKQLPFRVHTRDMNIVVTGTAFNVMAYNDERFSATTLVEGSVDIKNTSRKLSLTPGEQAVNNDGTSLIKNEVDVEQYIAWKNGLFQFNNTDIQSVMRQIGRWYDVSVEYRGKIPQTTFGGFISRDSKLSQVIKMLELSGVRFSIEDKKIVVLP